MDLHAGKLVLNGAPTQLSRLVPSPDALRARVDGRTPDELRAFGVDVAGLIRFFDLDDEPSGDWTPFFLSEPGMVSASMAGIAPAAALQAVEEMARRTRAETDPVRKREGLRRLFAAAHGMVRRADAWLHALDRLPADGATRHAARRLRAAVTRELGPALRRLHALDAGAAHPAALGAPLGLAYDGFHPAWELGRPAADAAAFAGTGTAERIDAAVPQATELFRTVAESVGALRDTGARLADDAPDGLQRPQLALFDAFVELFGTAQAALDTLPARYADFYYRDVLREPLRGAVPDRVYLAFTRQADFDGIARVPRGTAFPAGEDPDGHTLLYAAGRAITVTTATLQRVRMLRAVAGPLIVSATPSGSSEPASPSAAPSASSDPPSVSPPSERAGPAPASSDQPVVQQVLASRLAGAAEAEATGDDLASGAGWPTFGSGSEGEVDGLATAPAALGFAVATPELLLTGGDRTATLTFRFVPDDVLLARLDAVAGATGLDRWTALAAVLEAGLVLSVSTADGWFALEDYDASAAGPVADDAEASFRLVFHLPATVPAVVPLYEGGTPPDDAPVLDPAAALPTLTAHLRAGTVTLTGDAGTATVHPLPFLAPLSLNGVDVATDVRGLSGLSVANTDGEMDATTPFPVFGGTPAVGTYLEIRSPELFAKRPASLSVRLRWLGLPPNDDGFTGWYRDYRIGLDGEPQDGLFDNATFRGAWSVRNPGRWALATRTPEGETLPYEPVALFRTTHDPAAPEPEPDGMLFPETDFAAMPVVDTPAPPPYYQPTDSALRLELREPAYAFGNDLYAINVLNAVIEDLPDADDCQAECLAATQPLKDAAVALAACATPCTSSGDPACTSCVQSVLDALRDAALGCLGLAPPKQARVVRVRSVIAPELAARADDLVRAATAGTPAAKPDCGCTSRCAPLIAGAFAIQAMLDAAGSAGPTPDAVAACVATLDGLYARGVEACMTGCMQPGGELAYPNAPYLPTAEWVSVDYTAGCTLAPAGSACGALYHLLPFGGWMPAADPTASGAPLLGVPDEAATLLLGFDAMAEAQTLSLLFQMEARDGTLAAPAEVRWSRLEGDAWRGLDEGAVPLDGTNGLRNSGIVALRLPADASTGGTRLPGGQRWLRAATADAAGFPWTVSLRPHATVASWVDTGEGAGAHLARPLPAGTLTESVQELPGIDTLVQPMPSFGGRPPETGDTYRARLAERLRHKARAVQPWDHERLVLDRFPAVWMAAALPARDEAGPAAGATLVVVVAAESGNESADTATPRLPGALLAEIETFLSERASPFARIQVVNPVYVRVTVHATVAFRTGPDGGDLDTLNEDLIGWLSPWWYSAERAARGGHYASENDISEFVQTRPYVERVDALSLTHDPSPDALEWYVLTSAPAHDLRDAAEGSVVPATRGRRTR